LGGVLTYWDKKIRPFLKWEKNDSKSIRVEKNLLGKKGWVVGGEVGYSSRNRTTKRKGKIDPKGRGSLSKKMTFLAQIE